MPWLSQFTLRHLLPLFIGTFVGGSLFFFIGWWGFLPIFGYVGGCISLGVIVASYLEGAEKDYGRRIAILAISPVFIDFLGLMQRENLQI